MPKSYATSPAVTNKSFFKYTSSFWIFNFFVKFCIFSILNISAIVNSFFVKFIFFIKFSISDKFLLPYYFRYATM